jgi:serine O-acetyltransferase
MDMELRNSSRTALTEYTVRQVAHFFPDGSDNVRPRIEANLSAALHRLQTCINSVRCWKENEFSYLHSSQYCIYLYFLSNTIWKNTGDIEVCTKLFLLNKALNGIDCFYEIDLPEKFFIGHSVGIVLAKAIYSDYLVLYQNSTVGKNHGVAPVLEKGVVMYPNTAIIGRSLVRENTVISQGVSVINQNTPGNSAVFRGNNGLIFNALKRNILEDIFR